MNIENMSRRADFQGLMENYLTVPTFKKAVLFITNN